MKFLPIFMSKKLYILTGWGERLSDGNYRALISAVQNKCEIVPLKIVTRNPKFCLGVKPLRMILDSLEKQIKDPHTIVGFSDGALLAYLIAPKVKPKRLILCSLPPMISKDLVDHKFLTREQIKELSAMNYPDYPTEVFYGSEEDKNLKRVNKKLGGIEIKNANHKLEGEYLDTIIKKIRE